MLAGLALFVCLSGAAPAQLGPVWSVVRPAWDGTPAGAPLRVVAVAPRAAVIDVEALREGLNAAVEFVPLEAIVAGDELKLRRVGVLIVGNLGPHPPDALMDAIGRQLKQGGGVVLCGFRDAGFDAGSVGHGLAELEDAAAIPRGLSGPLPKARLYEGTKARLAVLNYDTRAPVTHGFVAPRGDLSWSAYGDALAPVVRALIWAARREPEIWIESVRAQEAPVPDELERPPGIPVEDFGSVVQAPGGARITRFDVELSSPLGRGFTIGGQIRYPERGQGWSYVPKETLAAGTSSFALHLPAGNATQRVDVRLLDGEELADWLSFDFEDAGWPKYDAIAFSGSRLNPNDTLSVNLRIPPHPLNPAHGYVWLRATDAYGRVVASERKAFPAGGGAIRLQSDFTHLVAPGLTAEVFAYASLGESLTRWQSQWAAHAQRWLPVGAPLPRYPLAVRAVAEGEWGGRLHYRRLRAAGVDAIVRGAGIGDATEIRQAGLFEIDAPEVLRFVQIDLRNRTAAEASHRVWQGLFGGAVGVEAAGAEWPGFNDDSSGTAGAWEAIVETMTRIGAGLDGLIAESDFRSSGAIAEITDDALPEYFDARKSRFLGSWHEFGFGRACVVAFLAGPREVKRSRAVLHFPADSFVYLPEEGRALDPRRPVRLEIEPGDAGFVTILPYEVSRVALDVPEIAARGRPLRVGIEIKTRHRLPGDHLVHLRLVPEDGEALDYYDTTVLCAEGFGETRIPLALNERTGAYRIVARDVLTGVTGEAEIEIAEPVPR